MYLNQFSVRIPEGREANGYVEVQHNTQYTLRLRNSRDAPCDARVEVDGKHVGTWRIRARESLQIERPAHDTGRFTFYRLGSSQAKQAYLYEDNPDMGLVKVTFTPEKKRVVSDSWTYCSKGVQEEYTSAWRGAVPSASSGYEAGGTGLSGESNQRFHNVATLDYDYSQQTVIHLRLVCKNGDPRPLTAYSTPVPPSVR